jgi:hypothetical protein
LAILHRRDAPALATARAHAARADFAGCLAHCQTLVDTHPHDPEALLSVGALLLDVGLLGAAEPASRVSAPWRRTTRAPWSTWPTARARPASTARRAASMPTCWHGSPTIR